MIWPVREISWESLDEPLRSKVNPDWPDVESRVQSLRCAASGAVFLKAANGSTLSIASDRGNGYLVFISDQRGERYLQAPPFERKGVASMVLGFQPGEYPRRIIVNLDAAFEAAREYFKTGRIEDNDNWTSDGTTVEL
jgi:hypothetical protein